MRRGGGNLLLGFGVVFVLYLVYKSFVSSQPKPVSSFGAPNIASFLGNLTSGFPPTVPFGYPSPATSGAVPGGAIGSDGTVYVSGVCQVNSAACDLNRVPQVTSKNNSANDPIADCLANPNLCFA